MKTEIDHGARDHAQWSASATARNWQCQGAMAMATICPEGKESEHAARGTAAHQISEMCLQTFSNAIDYLGTVEKTKVFDVEIDEEIVNSAQEYIDYVRKQSKDCELMLETRFSLASLDPPFQAGGTCDAIVLNAAERLVEVIDLKHGVGVVNAKENPQLRTYALGALLSLSNDEAANYDRIKVTIVQPRAPHREGRIRSEEFHVADLIEWTSELMKAMHRSKDAMDEFAKINGNRVLFDDWADKYLQTGACKFCPAEGMCPKQRSNALKVAPEIAQKWFEDPTAVTLPTLTNLPELMSPEERGHTLDGLQMLEDWIKALRSVEHTMAEKGNPATGWQLVDKEKRRAWAAPEEKIAADLKSVVKLTDDQIYKKTVISPAQVEKILGAKRKGEIASMWHNPPTTETNLVSVTKTTRPAAKSKTAQFFEETGN